MKQQLTLHIRAIHEKVRPFTCDLCSFAAARKQEVVRHRTAVHDPSKVTTYWIYLIAHYVFAHGNLILLITCANFIVYMVF